MTEVGIDVAEIRRRAVAAFGSGSFQFPRPAFSVPAKAAVKASLESAREAGQERIDTEHLLLGVLADENGGGAQALTALGVDAAALRSAVRRSGSLAQRGARVSR